MTVTPVAQQGGSVTQSPYPNGIMPVLGCLAGDGGTWNKLYICMGNGAGAAWGQFNFLLNRDLCSASNDNSPVGLDMAA